MCQTEYILGNAAALPLLSLLSASDKTSPFGAKKLKLGHIVHSQMAAITQPILKQAQ